MMDETARMLADLARAKAAFQQRAIVAILKERRTAILSTVARPP
jgi:hypothetical protein